MNASFEDLKSKVFTGVVNQDNEVLLFVVSDDESYQLYHDQDCCERVIIEDIVGDLQDLIGNPILLAEVVDFESDKTPNGMKVYSYDDSFTWTFYKLSTIKGSVTIRWHGSSNGYYSETVNFKKV
jgi:hypothetical protein